MRLYLVFGFSFLTHFVFGQYFSGVSSPDSMVPTYNSTDSLKLKLISSITPDDLKKHLYTLASDEFKGRETGSEGNVLASKYIANQFANMGLQPGGDEGTFFQNITFTTTSWDKLILHVGQEPFRNLWDYLAFPELNTNMDSINFSEVVFLGYGIKEKKHNDYKKAKVKNKIIMIHKGEPMRSDSLYKISGSDQESGWDMERKLKLAKEEGVKLVLIIEDDIKKVLGENRRKLLSPQMVVGNEINKPNPLANHIYISSTIAKSIIGNKESEVLAYREKLMKSKKPKSLTLQTQGSVEMMRKQSLFGQAYESPDGGRNILGFIPGTDKKDEVIVISAHYDHLGERGKSIYYGADDNASGTSTVLELAEAFAIAKKEGNGSRRSLLFMLMTAEEKGLLGSQYYSDKPIYPLEKTVANVNLDMVGRVDEKYKDNPNYIYVIGSDRLSTDLHKINENINNRYSKLVLDYTYNDDKDPNQFYFRSDHYNFARKGVPAIFFFNGVHADYHQPSDTPDKINYNKMSKIGQHVGILIYELANRNDRIVVDGEIR